MNESRRKTPVKRFRINDKISAVASASPDPLVRQVRNNLEAFECSEVIGSRYVWKYLPDDAFVAICDKPTAIEASVKAIATRAVNRTLSITLICFATTI
jgi:hypothetical protein